MTLVLESQLILLGCALLNVIAIIFYAVRGKDGFRMRALILLSYLIDNVASGIVHVFHLSRDRGFYEAMAGAPTGAGTGLIPASWACLLGLIALIIGLHWSRPPRRARHEEQRQEYSWAANRRSVALGAGIVLSLVCAAAWAKVVAATAATGGRIIAVGGGNARYVTLSGWLPWGMTLLALAIVARRRTAWAPWWNALVVAGSALAIIGSMAWSGGRSSLVFAVMPLLAATVPALGRAKWPLLAAGGLAMGFYLWLQTLNRVTGSGKGQTDLGGIIDWQWGRFSMSAWAFRYISQHGTVHGETLLSSLIAVPAQFAHFAGVNLPFQFRTMVELSGESLLGSSELIYIVPGLNAELIANFGFGGIIIGYLVLGRLTGWLADQYRDCRFELTRVLLVYVATIVVLSTIVDVTEAFFLDLVMGGMPLIILAIVERRRARKDLLQAERA